MIVLAESFLVECDGKTNAEIQNLVALQGSPALTNGLVLLLRQRETPNQQVWPVRWR